MTKYKVYNNCSVYGCLNKQNNVNLSFFTLPKDCDKRNVWLKVMGRTDLLNKSELKHNSYRVCSIHFERSMLSEIHSYKLLPDAVPTKYLPTTTDPQPSTSNDETELNRSKDTSTQTKGPGGTSIRKIINATSSTPETQTTSEKEKEAQTSMTLASETCEMPGCALRYCTNTSKNTNKSTGTSFHRFVKQDSQYFDAWLQFVRSDRSEPIWYPNEHSYLCSEHFRDEDFIITHTGRSFLKKSAVPRFPSKYDALHPESSRPNSSSVEISDASEPAFRGSFSWDASRVALKKSEAASTRAEDKKHYEHLVTAARTIRTPSTVCCVFGCRNNVFDHPDRQFHPFPTDQLRRGEWLRLINRQDLAAKLKAGSTSNKVCSDHFDEYDYSQGALSQDAMPHLGLPKKRAKFVYAPDAEAGPSGLQATEVKREPDDDDAMAVEINFEPEEPPTIKFINPTIPKINVTPIQPQPILLPIIASPAVQPPNIPTPNIRPILQNALQPTIIPTIVTSVGLDNLPVIQNAFNVVQVGQDGSNPSNVETKISSKNAFFKRATISAIEQINLKPVIPSIASVHVQTTKKLIDIMNLPLKKKHNAEKRDAMKKIRYLERELNNPKMNKTKFLECCDRFLDEKIANIVKSHATLLDKYQGNRYSDSFKTFALNLYLCSPQSYKFVEQFFYLPSMKTIQRSRIPVRTGINPNLIEGLKVKVDEMTDSEKICTVCFDYMAVNRNLYYDVTNDYLCGIQDIDQVLGSEPAQYAPLIMVRGMYSKWKQPVSFALVSKKIRCPALKEWLIMIIAMLLHMGLKVKAFVADFDSEFLDFCDISATEPYIEVEGQTIYQVFDTPKLYINARDDLIKYDFHIGSKVVKWGHILKVYETDKKQELSLMPKITEQHVRPDEASKSDVKKAIQVFSRTVAAAMNFHVVANMIPKKTKDTVEFIRTMNHLFDMLNSRNFVGECENESKQTYKGTEEQKGFLMSAVQYLQMLEMKDKGGNSVEKKMTFATGLMITIKSVMALHEDLLKEHFKYIATKNLSKDCMETYFKKVRLLGGNCCERPTPIMFTRSFRRLFLRNLVSNTKEGGTVIDLKSTLTKISEYVKTDIKEEPDQNRSLNVGISDYQHLWPLPPTSYIAGYLLWKILEKHQCLQMIENLNKHYKIEATDNEQLLLIFKQFNGDNLKRKDMPKPPEYLVEFVEKMEDMFNEYYVRADMVVYNFGWNVYLTMEGEQFKMPCQCFPLKSLKFLFIRLKIFNLVKDYNRKNRPMRKTSKGIRKRFPKD